MQIHQVLVGAGPHDAISLLARQLRPVLQRIGESEIFAKNVLPGAEDARELAEFPRAGSGSGVIVFHASYGAPEVLRFLLGRPEPIVLVFHNISPVEHFERTDPIRASMLLWAWRELELLRDRVVAAVAESSFNAEELRRIGYRDVRVLPVGADPQRLARVAPDPSAMATLAPFAGDPLVAFVGQALPHKRIEVLLHAQLLLDRGGIRSSLALVGPPSDPVLARAHAELVRDLGIPRCLLLGALGDDALAAVLRNADVLATASEHEGLCLPALEAMAMGVPVVGRRVGALPETVGAGGLLLDPDAGPAEFAEAVALVHEDRALARGLAAQGRAQAARVDPARSTAAFLEVIEEVVG